MFTLLVSSKGFCAADEEMAGARATAASAKPIIENIGTYMMFEEISTDENERLIEERTVYNRHAAKLPVVLYTSTRLGDISDTLQSMLRGLKPGEEILIRGIYYPSTIDSISECGVVLSYVFPIMRAGIFMKE